MPDTADFEAGELPVEVIVVWDAEGGWHAATVLYRAGDSEVATHPQWSESFTLSANPWEYLAERLREGRGGNGYDYDIWGFEVAHPDDIAPVVTAREAEVVGATHGPMGEPAIVSFGGGGELGQADDVEHDSEHVPEAERLPAVLVTRAPAPEWWSSVLPDAAHDAMSAKHADDSGWGYAVPWLHRALASPLTFEPMPKLADPPQRHPEALGYWTTLLYMLLYSLGWARADRGLAWWYDAGCPTDDTRLALLDEVWRRDGHLEAFALWLSRSTGPLPLWELNQLTGYRHDGSQPVRHPDWASAAEDERALFGLDRDCYHLSRHTKGPLQAPPGEALLIHTDKSKRRAVLLLDSMTGWYRALHAHGSTLVELGERSWHVDVVACPVGWLGTYRRSRKTGLWFSGRHRYHTPGT